MRLVMFEPQGQPPRMGVLRTQVVGLAARSPSAYFASTAQFLVAGGEALPHAESLPRPGKIVAIGLNCRDPSLEQGVPLPSAPLIFAKFPTSVIGPYDPSLIPTGDPKWIIKQAVIIGLRSKSVAP